MDDADRPRLIDPLGQAITLLHDYDDALRRVQLELTLMRAERDQALRLGERIDTLTAAVTALTAALARAGVGCG